MVGACIIYAQEALNMDEDKNDIDEWRQCLAIAEYTNDPADWAKAENAKQNMFWRLWKDILRESLGRNEYDLFSDE